MLFILLVLLSQLLLCNYMHCTSEYIHINNEASTNISSNIYQPYNETDLKNFTFTLSKNISNLTPYSFFPVPIQVDCFGLGKTVASLLASFFASKANNNNPLDIQFLLSSRRQTGRVIVITGEQFGLEWTDFKIERRTVIIVHGFLSHGNESWIIEMERAFLGWNDVNVVVVDWSAGGNTWNYYKAAVNTKTVGHQISKFLEHIVNSTLSTYGSNAINWGPLHLIGHSLGAHICGFAAKEFRKRQSKWVVQRITGLDPAQPCFNRADPSLHLHKTDAIFVDIIHTNGRLLSSVGLGLPEAIGHVDIYPNGGKRQPGCMKSTTSYFSYLPLPQTAIQEAICSHGRSHVYLTESLLAATTNNCSFWAHHWDLTYRHAIQIIPQSCNKEVCIEMGINAENYPYRGTFLAATASNPPFCHNSTEIVDEVKMFFELDNTDELKD